MKHIYESDDEFKFNWDSNSVTYVASSAPPRDVFTGGPGVDEIYGLNNKDDQVYAGAGQDVIGDRVNDNDTQDEYWGQGGNDKMEIFAGRDQMYGGGGDDFMEARAGYDINPVTGLARGLVIRVEGGEDFDTLKINNSDDGVRHDLTHDNWDFIYVTVDTPDGQREALFKVNDDVEKIQYA